MRALRVNLYTSYTEYVQIQGLNHIRILVARTNIVIYIKGVSETVLEREDVREVAINRRSTDRHSPVGV